MAKRRTRDRRRSNRSSHKDTRKNIPTEELRDFVADDERAPQDDALPARPVARPAARLEGQGRAGPRPTSPCPSCPIYIQEKIHPQALIEHLRAHREAGETEPELDLFADFNGARRASTRRSTSTSTTSTGRTG